jgi:hypothetical protein
MWRRFTNQYREQLLADKSLNFASMNATLEFVDVCAGVANLYWPESGQVLMLTPTTWRNVVRPPLERCAMRCHLLIVFACSLNFTSLDVRLKTYLQLADTTRLQVPLNSGRLPVVLIDDGLAFGDRVCTYHCFSLATHTFVFLGAGLVRIVFCLGPEQARLDRQQVFCPQHSLESGDAGAVAVVEIDTRRNDHRCFCMLAGLHRGALSLRSPRRRRRQRRHYNGVAYRRRVHQLARLSRA